MDIGKNSAKYHNANKKENPSGSDKIAIHRIINPIRFSYVWAPRSSSRGVGSNILSFRSLSFLSKTTASLDRAPLFCAAIILLLPSSVWLSVRRIANYTKWILVLTECRRSVCTPDSPTGVRKSNLLSRRLPTQRGGYRMLRTCHYFLDNG